LEYILIDKTNVCVTFIDELEETNGRLIFEDENYEKDKHSDEDKSSEEVDTREHNDELEDTNGRLIFEDENYEKNEHSDEDKSSEEVDTRDVNTQSAEDKLNGKYILRKVNDEIIQIVKRAKHNTTISNQVHCEACINENYPTRLHKCICCKKSDHMLFGCLSSIPGTKEGSGKRICFDCDKKKSMNDEKVACEGCNKKGQATKKLRSAHSYISPQPGFELIDFNRKAFIKPIFFLKNGNSMM